MNRLGVQGYTIRDYMKDKKQFGETLKNFGKLGTPAWIMASRRV